MSAPSGYVVIPRCSLIFDGTNYPDFAAFMRIHMRGLRLWGVLSGEVFCPSCPIAPAFPLDRRPQLLLLMLLRLRRIQLRALMMSRLLHMTGWI
jgi:hypothetical protein